MDIGIVIDIFVVDGGWLSGLSGWSEVLIPGGGRAEATLGQVERRAFVATQVPVFVQLCIVRSQCPSLRFAMYAR